VVAGAVEVALGGAFFIARSRTTRFGMLQPNTNIFLRVRWSHSFAREDPA
jgi:hypothetical protein